MKRLFLISALFGILGASLVHIPSASANLPSAYEAKLKLATEVNFGKAIQLAVPKCKFVKVKSKYSETCTYEKFTITVNSFKFNDRRQTSMEIEQSTYAIDIKMENFSSQDKGLDVGEFLKCKSSRSGSDFYRDGIDPQSVPAKSQDEGIVVASFPDKIDVTKCESPVLWIMLTNSAGADVKNKKMMAEIKKKKLIGIAYIPLTPQLLLGS